MRHLCSDFDTILERFRNYEYSSKGIDKKTVERSTNDVLYRTMRLEELEEIVTKSILRLGRNDVFQGFVFKSVNLNAYPYFKSFFRTQTNAISEFYSSYAAVVEFDRFTLKSLPNSKLFSISYFHSKLDFDRKTEDESEERLYSKDHIIKIKNLSKLIKCIWIKKTKNINKDLLNRINDLGIELRHAPDSITSLNDLFSHNSPRTNKENLYNFDKKTCDKVIKELYLKGFKDYINGNTSGEDIDWAIYNNAADYTIYNNIYYVNLEDNKDVEVIFNEIHKSINEHIVNILNNFFPSTIGIEYNILNDRILKNTKRTFKTKRYVKTKHGFLLQQKKKNKAANKIDWINVAYYGDIEDIDAFINSKANKIFNKIKFINKGCNEYTQRLQAKLIYKNSLRDFLKPTNFDKILIKLLSKSPIFNNNSSKFIIISNDKDSLINEIKAELQDYIANNIDKNNTAPGDIFPAYDSEFDRVLFIKKNIDKILDKIEFVDESNLSKNADNIIQNVCEIYLDNFLKPDNILTYISTIKNISYTYEKSSNMIFLKTDNINGIKLKIEKMVIEIIMGKLNKYFEGFNINIKKNLVVKFVKENNLKLFNNIEFATNKTFLKQSTEIFKSQCKKYFNEFMTILNLKNLLISNCGVIPIFNKEKGKFICPIQNGDTKIIDQLKKLIKDYLMDKIYDFYNGSITNYKINANNIIEQYVDDNFYKISNKVQFCPEIQFDKKAKVILNKSFEEIKYNMDRSIVCSILKLNGIDYKDDNGKINVKTNNIQNTIENIKKTVLQYIIRAETRDGDKIFKNNEEFITEYLKKHNHYADDFIKFFFDKINIIY